MWAWRSSESAILKPLTKREVRMKTKKKILAAVIVAAVVVLVGIYMSMTSAPALADTHSDLCLANYNQCLKGCDGATSCTNQCAVNYNGCLQQGR